MAAGQGADAYIELADFTGGIATTHASGDKAQMVREDPEDPRVYAQRDYTAGCYGHPLGGLYPLPGIRDEVVEDDGDWADASVFPGSEQAMVVNATSILSPTVNPWFRVSDSYDGTLYRDTPDQLTVVYGSWGHPGGDDAYIGSGYSDEHYFIGLAEVRVFLMGGTMRDKTDLLGGHKVSDTQWLGDARIIEKSSVGTLDTTLAAKISRGLSPVSCFPLVTTAKGSAADAIGFPVTAVVS